MEKMILKFSYFHNDVLFQTKTKREIQFEIEKETLTLKLWKTMFSILLYNSLSFLTISFVDAFWDLLI